MYHVCTVRSTNKSYGDEEHDHDVDRVFFLFSCLLSSLLLDRRSSYSPDFLRNQLNTASDTDEDLETVEQAGERKLTPRNRICIWHCYCLGRDSVG